MQRVQLHRIACATLKILWRRTVEKEGGVEARIRLICLLDWINKNTNGKHYVPHKREQRGGKILMQSFFHSQTHTPRGTCATIKATHTHCLSFRIATIAGECSVRVKWHVLDSWKSIFNIAGGRSFYFSYVWYDIMGQMVAIFISSKNMLEFICKLIFVKKSLPIFF